jgi:hypothetical protein
MRFGVLKSSDKDYLKKSQRTDISISFFHFSLFVIISIFSLRSIISLTCLRPGSCSGQCTTQSRAEKAASIKQDSPAVCRVAFHPSYYKNRYMVVDGYIPARNLKTAESVTGGKSYPLVLDTGASQSIFLNARQFRDNKLDICPDKNNQTYVNGYTLGSCKLSELCIGQISFRDWTCRYLDQRQPVKLFGITMPLRLFPGSSWDDNVIILGLPLLRQFKYIAFDCVNKQVEFSYSQLFEPQQDEWDKYQFYIEEDFHGNAFLFVRIPIAGSEVELQLDTGSGRGLSITENLWSQIQASMPDTKNIRLKKASDFYPYIGRFKCRRGVAAELKVGELTVKNAEISVFANNNPLLEDCTGMIGMQYFQNTVIVLDFERTLFWIMNKKIPGET